MLPRPVPSAIVALLAILVAGDALASGARSATDAANQGHACYKKKQYREAASYFELAISFDATEAEYYYWSSMSHSAAMEDQEAYEWIRGALSLDETDARYHAQHGRACQYLGHPGEAVMAYEKALELNGGDAGIWASYAMVLKQSGHPYQAMEAYHKALDLKPDLPGVAFDLGQSLMELKDPEQAAVAFRKAVEAEPRCLECHIDLGDALMASGNPRAALAAYEDAHRQAPEDWRPTERSIQACYALADFQAAERHKRALQRMFDQGQVYALGDRKAFIVDRFEVRDLTVKVYEYYEGHAPDGVHWTFLAFDPTGWQERELAVRDAVAVAAPGGRAPRSSGVELVDVREDKPAELLTTWSKKVSYPTARTAVIEWLRPATD